MSSIFYNDQLLIPLLVLLAALLHASWNALLKNSRDRLGGQCVIAAVDCLIGLVGVVFVPLPALDSIPFLIGSTIVHSIYYATLVAAYRHGALSHVYPLARGMAPFLVTVTAVFVANEHLSPVGWAGVILVSTGIISLAVDKSWFVRDQRHSILWAILTGLLIATYTIFDGLGSRTSGHPISFIFWLFLVSGTPFLAICAWRRGRHIFGTDSKTWQNGIIGGILGFIAYGIVLWSLARGAFAGIIALRETSVVFALFIGALFLKERFGPRRILAVALVAAGNVALRL